MEFLIIFDTVEGQTLKIANFVEQRLRAAGHAVQTFNAEDKRASMSLSNIDKVILAAPVHERRHPKSFEVLVAASQNELSKRLTMLISVSLKAAFPDSLEEANDYVTEMNMRTGFTPDKVVLAAGAVRTSSYGYFESQIVQNVALAGHDVNLEDGEREFTDWAALGSEVDAFVDAAPKTT